MLTRCGQAGLTVFLSGSRVGHWGLILLLAGILGSMIVFVLLFYLNNKHGFEEARVNVFDVFGASKDTYLGRPSRTM